MEISQGSLVIATVIFGILFVLSLISYLKAPKQETPSDHCPFCGQKILDEVDEDSPALPAGPE